MTNERLRASFKPETVKILFIGESPPAGETFFYSANSNLYRITKQAFEIAFGKTPESDFLSEFKEMGCYLVDLCLVPVNLGLTKKQRKLAHKQGIPGLVATIRILRPEKVVVVMKGIEKEVREALSLAGFSGQVIILPFPNWPHQRAEYQTGLIGFLKGER